MTNTINTHEEDFEKIVRDAGIPVTDEEMQAEWDQINDDQNSLIKNDSAWSPFWKLISTIVTSPAKWVVNFLIYHLLPNSYVKTAGKPWLDIMAWGLDLERKDAVEAIGNITFTRESLNTPVVVPAGTLIHSTTINNTIYEMVVISDTDFKDGEITEDVPCKAADTGDNYNLAPGYYQILPVAVAGIVSVRNNDDWLTTPGANQESNDELRLRTRNQFTAVGLFHHDAAYRQIISEFAAIRTDFLFFEHDAPRGPGTANCYIMIESGIPPDDFVEEINTHITDNGFHGHGDSMICYPIPVIETHVTLKVWPVPNLTSTERSQLQQDIENMVRCAFRQNTDYQDRVTQTWAMNLFSFSRLTEELHQAFPSIKTLEFENTDIITELNLPVLSSLDFTLEAG